MPALVTLATYKQSKTAYFLKAKLENENIDCFIAIISSTEGKWDEVRVQVKEEDVERAIMVMLRIKDEHGANIDKIEPDNMVRKIIVPTDFSKGSEHACYYAIHLAQKMNAEIKLLHVYENPVADLSIKETATYQYRGIKDFADRNQTNLLSLTVHKRGIFEKLFKPNLFKKILQESNLPILIFPS